MEVFAAANRGNLTLNHQGVRHVGLSARPQVSLPSSDVYVGRIRRGHAGMRLVQVKAHLDETWFASLDPCDDASPVYHRKQA